MNIKSIQLFLSILTTILLFSCTPKTVKVEDAEFNAKYYLTKDTSVGAISINIDVQFPIDFAEKSVVDSIRTTIISNLFGEKYVSIPTDSIIHRFTTDLKNEYIENNLPLVNELDSASPYSFNNEHTLSGFKLLSDKHIFSYGIERFVYMGGAHGLETRNYYNFNLKNGKLIRENDLYIDNYLSSLSELMKKIIIEQNQDIKNSEPISSIDDTDFWTDSIKPNTNFYITDESINYVFNPYEIGPYYLGQTEISIPFDRLKAILKPENPISYLTNKLEKK